MDRHLLAAAAAALLAACAAKDAPPAPRADPPYVFPHSPHVENDVACVECQVPLWSFCVMSQARALWAVSTPRPARSSA